MVNRPFSSRPGLLLALAVTLLSPGAWAQKELVALHPCVITGGKPKAPTAEFEAACALEVARTNVELVPSSAVRDYLDKEARGSCARAKNRNACLGRLATSAKASRTLYLTVSPYSPVTRITGLVVDARGKVVEQQRLDLPRVRKQLPVDTVRIAVSQILSRLTLTATPATSATEALPTLDGSPTPPEPEPPPAVVEAPKPPPAPAPVVTPAAAPPPAAQGRTWKTPVGLAGMGAGAVVGLGLTTLFVLQSNSSVDKVNAFYEGGAGPLLTDENVREIQRLREDTASKRTLALVTGVTGAVLAGAGAYLWLTDGPPKAPPPAGTARLTAGPGSVGLLVVLP